MCTVCVSVYVCAKAASSTVRSSVGESAGTDLIRVKWLTALLRTSFHKLVTDTTRHSRTRARTRRLCCKYALLEFPQAQPWMKLQVCARVCVCVSTVNGRSPKLTGKWNGKRLCASLSRIRAVGFRLCYLFRCAAGQTGARFIRWSLCVYAQKFKPFVNAFFKKRGDHDVKNTSTAKLQI